MRGVRISATVCGVHDVVYSGGDVWYRNGRCFELYCSVSCGGVGAVPGAMVVEMLYGRKR